MNWLLFLVIALAVASVWGVALKRMRADPENRSVVYSNTGVAVALTILGGVLYIMLSVG